MLANNDNIVKIIGYQDTEMTIVMDLCDGNVFRLFVNTGFDLVRHITLDEQINLRLQAISEISQGCQFIHDLNIVHFDIKSANILYKKVASDKYVFKVSDFGVSRAYSYI